MESILKNAGERGLSVRQMRVLLQKSKKAVKREIRNSTSVKCTDPGLHGSGKQRIKVFSYTESNGISFKNKNKTIVPTIVPTIEPTIEVPTVEVPTVATTTAGESDWTIV